MLMRFRVLPLTPYLWPAVEDLLRRRELQPLMVYGLRIGHA